VSVRLVGGADLKRLVARVGAAEFMRQLIAELAAAYARWDEFEKMARPATHVPGGVIELMPISDATRYAFKYVNGHPRNPEQGYATVVAIGMLTDATNGYPLLVSEMTVLTALRTAGTSALAARHLARRPSRTMALIGTGAQAEFQALAFQVECGVTTVRAYDTDPAALAKFARHGRTLGLGVVVCGSVAEAVTGADIITTATAAKARARILTDALVAPGVHINGIGGDCPGKTELEAAILSRAKVVVEFTPQSLIEGEVQQTGAAAIHAELHELVRGLKPGRERADEVTVFDSVGFALEDYAALMLVQRLATQYGIGQATDLIPDLADPKDLWSALH
jgi:ornithine cyclodeaminase